MKTNDETEKGVFHPMKAGLNQESSQPFVAFVISGMMGEAIKFFLWAWHQAGTDRARLVKYGEINMNLRSFLRRRMRWRRIIERMLRLAVTADRARWEFRLAT
ncbi:hypothetical protein L0337_19840 [candidate division KSB1 bacterium]|nr:hypothetical protein [candidate division KSB1 bacterium]